MGEIGPRRPTRFRSALDPESSAIGNGRRLVRAVDHRFEVLRCPQGGGLGARAMEVCECAGV